MRPKDDEELGGGRVGEHVPGREQGAIPIWFLRAESGL